MLNIGAANFLVLVTIAFLGFLFVSLFFLLLIEHKIDVELIQAQDSYIKVLEEQNRELISLSSLHSCVRRDGKNGGNKDE